MPDNCNTTCNICSCSTCTCTCVATCPSVLEDGCPSDLKLECIKFEQSPDTNCLDITNADTGAEIITKIIDEICTLKSGDSDKYVRISNVDTTSGYLINKIKKKTGSILNITKKNSGLNEYLEFDIDTTTLIETPFIGIDSDGIDYTAGGTNGHAPIYKVKLDPTSHAALTVGPSGLKLTLPTTASETSLVATDTASINFTTGGTAGHNLTGVVLIDGIISATANNAITNSSNGLFSPILTSDNGITKASNNFKLGGALTADTTVSGAFKMNFTTKGVSINQGDANVESLFVGNATNEKALVVYGKSLLERNITFSTTGIGATALEVNAYTSGASILESGAAITSAAFNELLLLNTGNNTISNLSPVSGHVGSINKQSTGAYTGGIISGYTSVGTLRGSGNISDWAGFRAITPRLLQGNGAALYTGTITNYYGVYIENSDGSDVSTSITNRYGLYQAGPTDKNYFKAPIESGATSYWLLPVGTTAQRPTATAGRIRYNSTTGRPEFANGTTWVSL